MHHTTSPISLTSCCQCLRKVKQQLFFTRTKDEETSRAMRRQQARYVSQCLWICSFQLFRPNQSNSLRTHPFNRTEKKPKKTKKTENVRTLCNAQYTPRGPGKLAAVFWVTIGLKAAQHVSQFIVNMTHTANLPLLSICDPAFHSCMPLFHWVKFSLPPCNEWQSWKKCKFVFGFTSLKQFSVHGEKSRHLTLSSNLRFLTEPTLNYLFHVREGWKSWLLFPSVLTNPWFQCKGSFRNIQCTQSALKKFQVMSIWQDIKLVQIVWRLIHLPSLAQPKGLCTLSNSGFRPLVGRGLFAPWGLLWAPGEPVYQYTRERWDTVLSLFVCYGR